MQKFKSGDMVVEPGTQLFIEGAKAAQLYTVLSGLGVRYKSLPDGRRQVVNFVMPGDFLGLQAGIMREMSHSVEATTAMRLCVFNRSRFFELFQNAPERAFDLTYLAAVEEHFLAEALVAVGQGGAREKVAWALQRFHLRGKALGLVNKGHMPLPFRQQDLADALGISLVHTNKTLARLRKEGIVAWQDGVLTVLDAKALAAIATTDETSDSQRPLF